MAEKIRNIKVTIEILTNNTTWEVPFTLEDNESPGQFIKRVNKWTKENILKVIA